MKKQKRVIMGVIVLAILLMGIGYAAYEATELTIGGTASATAKQENFKVYFTGESTVVSTEDNVEVAVTAETTTANVTITDLSVKGDTEHAILQIKNGSVDIDATSVNVTAEGTDANGIDIEAVMCNANGEEITDYSVASGAFTYVKVSATLTETPTENVSATIDVTLTAEPKNN